MSDDDKNWHDEFVRQAMAANASRMDSPELEQDTPTPASTDVSTTTPVDYDLSTPIRVVAPSATVAAEREALLAEHRNLAQKRFSEAGLTPVEAKRLAYVRWHLDRIEADELDERLGHLEKLAALSEEVAAQVEDFRAQVAAQPRRPIPDAWRFRQ